ncbi:MAG TPA: hypothetical protein VD928_01340 [Candidatus Paceibacterota bacterium]|nr:hypothetical protein [Candidatus Paceibacterota bacterium]
MTPSDIRALNAAAATRTHYRRPAAHSMYSSRQRKEVSEFETRTKEFSPGDSVIIATKGEVLHVVTDIDARRRTVYARPIEGRGKREGYNVALVRKAED